MRFKNPRQKSEAHLDFIRELPCCVCLNQIETEAAHVRYSDASVGKVNPGSHKPHDFWCVPLCSREHREQHEAGDEQAWWKSKRIDPLRLAMALYLNTGDHERGTQIVANATRCEAA